MAATINVCTAILILIGCSAAAQIPAQFGPIHGRIVGGQDAEPHSAPWIVSMQYGFTPHFTSHMCAGAIIHPHWVLTAAHCITSVPLFGTWLLFAGRHNIRFRSAAEAEHEQSRAVVRRQTWRHPNATFGQVGPFDIALIRVERAFDLARGLQVAAIALPTAQRIHDGQAHLHGWGSTSTTSTPTNPAILQTVEKPIVPWTECQEALGSDSPLHETNMCTGPLTGGVSACSGDSGGPLSQDGELVGIVSWGRLPCGSDNSPSVHVRVSAFNGWIEELIARN